MIPESQNEDSLTGEKFRSLSILYFMLDAAMTSSIKLDRKMSFRTIEINYVAINGVLSSEFEVREVPISEMAPQYSFVKRGIFA
jgi:hypothetical protein